MDKLCVLYNPLSGTTTEQKVKDLLAKFYPDANCELNDVTKIEDLKAFISNLEGEKVLLLGGDGTLNKFVNRTDGLELNNIYYYPLGSGNDFWHDIGGTDEAPICIDKYIKNLPTVTVNGENYKFINGIGFGIDGYCCEVGDKQKAEGKEVNYTVIAITGLLFHYKPCDGTVIVDGEEHRFKKIWIAPTMHGRFYGGGLMPTPEQDRLNGEGKVSVCVLSGYGKIKTLMTFPTIFKGEHIKAKMTNIFSGTTVTVKFDEPRALQIDGETILGVTEYTVKGYEN